MSTNDSTHNRRFSLLSRLHGARDLMKPGRHCVTNVLVQWVSFCVYNCNVTFIFWNNFGTLIFPIVRLCPYLWFIAIFAPWMVICNWLLTELVLLTVNDWTQIWSRIHVSSRLSRSTTHWPSHWKFFRSYPEPGTRHNYHVGASPMVRYDYVLPELRRRRVKAWEVTVNIATTEGEDIAKCPITPTTLNSPPYTDMYSPLTMTATPQVMPSLDFSNDQQHVFNFYVRLLQTFWHTYTPILTAIRCLLWPVATRSC